MAPNAELTKYPTIRQTIVPVITYQVQARSEYNLMKSIQIIDVSIPTTTPIEFALFVRTPSKKAPSIVPYTSDAIVKPTVKTEPQFLAKMAIAIRIIPHAAVSHRDSFSSDSSLASGRISGL